MWPRCGRLCIASPAIVSSGRAHALAPAVVPCRPPAGWLAGWLAGLGWLAGRHNPTADPAQPAPCFTSPAGLLLVSQQGCKDHCGELQQPGGRCAATGRGPAAAFAHTVVLSCKADCPSRAPAWRARRCAAAAAQTRRWRLACWQQQGTPMSSRWLADTRPTLRWGWSLRVCGMCRMHGNGSSRGAWRQGQGACRLRHSLVHTASTALLSNLGSLIVLEGLQLRPSSDWLAGWLAGACSRPRRSGPPAASGGPRLDDGSAQVRSLTSERPTCCC